MHKLVLLFFMCLGMLSACKKSADDLSYPYHLNVSINNVKYSTSSVATFGLTNEPGCVANKSFDLTNVGQIDVTDYFLDCYIKHFTKNADFASTKPGSHKIFDGGDLLKSDQCNCDLIIGLQDNSILNFYNTTLLQPTNIVNKVTAITKLVKNPTDTTTNYSVSGTFSCTFKNTNNVLIPVSGDYVLPLKELN